VIFEQIATGGCQSYIVGCPESRAAVLIDPEIRQIDRYLAAVAAPDLINSNDLSFHMRT
jgi:hypothetical protein